MVGGEGDVGGGVPVFCGDFEGEGGGGEGEEGVDEGGYGAAVGDGEGAVLLLWWLVCVWLFVLGRLFIWLFRGKVFNGGWVEYPYLGKGVVRDGHKEVVRYRKAKRG